MPDAHKNFAYSTVATAPSPATSGTSLVVGSGDGAKFPAVPFNATIWPASSQPTSANAEIVRVTARSTDTLTITRAQESSSARTVIIGDQIAATVTAKTLTDVEAMVSHNINQSSHGFSVGNVVIYNGSSYAKAKADSAADAEVVGIVTVVIDTNNFVLATAGYITGLSSLTAGDVYFLDPSTAGALTATIPSTTGQIIKPLLVADSTTSGYFVNYRGQVIGGSPSGLLNIQVLTATGPANQTYTPTAGTTSFLAELIGGGGGGGNGLNTAANNRADGGGGGGGAYASYFNNSVAASYVYSCGAGGGINTNATGTAGNNTIFGNASNNCAYGNAGGGGGGGFNNTGGAGGGAAAGGAGGTPNTGLLKMAGGHGSPGYHGGNNIAINDLAVGGLGGDAPRGGIGGSGGALSVQAATAGGNYGAGGGGSASNNSTAAAGAAGAQGVIIVWEYT